MCWRTGSGQFTVLDFNETGNNLVGYRRNGNCPRTVRDIFIRAGDEADGFPRIIILSKWRCQGEMTRMASPLTEDV